MTGVGLSADGITVDLAGRRVLDAISVNAQPAQVIGIVGPNGSGKSTLLRVLTRTLKPTSGSVHIDGVDIESISHRRLARVVAAVLQDTTGDFDLQARDVVAMGRAPYKRMFERDNIVDQRIIDEALKRTDAEHLASRPFALMSGGERQRVLIARALAQRPRLLVLDEPTNHLDIRHQFDTLALPAQLGITAVMALHDLNLAAYYCDIVHVLHRGVEVCSGAPADVLTTGLIAEVYGVSAAVGPNPETGRIHVHYDPTSR